MNPKLLILTTLLMLIPWGWFLVGFLYTPKNIIWDAEVFTGLMIRALVATIATMFCLYLWAV